MRKDDMPPETSPRRNPDLIETNPRQPSGAPDLLGRRDALFLDFDGTLVDIAETPGKVEIPQVVPVLLSEVGDRLEGALAVVSGRPLAVLADLLSPFTGAIAGVHGLEHRTAQGTILRLVPDPAVERVRPLLDQLVAATPGLVLEDKGLSLALHYREAPQREADCLRIAEEVERLSEGRLIAGRGKMVIELRPHEANKGRAIVEFLREPTFSGRRPVFVGDDHMDEAGFEAVNRLSGISICVGERPDTAASYRIQDVAAVRAWLAASLSAWLAAEGSR